ncbi:MAG: hypothetical protein ACOX2U_05920 [Limisphaerales bacterium]|jgi:hypothetical protein
MNKKYYSLIVVLVGVIAVAISVKYKPTTKPLPQCDQPLIREATQKGLDWEKLPFVSVSDTNKLNEYLRNIQINGDELLSADQREKAYTSFLLLAQAYSVGTYEAYMRFRLPAGAKYEKNDRMWDYWLSEWKTDDPHWLQEHPDSKVVVPKDEDFHHWIVRKSSEGTFFKDLWKGVCVDPKKIYAELGTTNLKGNILKAGIYVHSGAEAKKDILETTSFYRDKIVKSTFNAAGGLSFSDPNFLFLSIPNEGTEKNDSSWRSLSFYFFVKPISPEPVTPIYAFFFWDKECSQWLPVQLIIGNILADDKILCFP